MERENEAREMNLIRQTNCLAHGFYKARAETARQIFQQAQKLTSAELLVWIRAEFLGGDK